MPTMRFIGIMATCEVRGPNTAGYSRHPVLCVRKRSQCCMLHLGVGTRSRSSMQLRALPLHLLRFCLWVSVAGSPKVSSPVPAQPVIGTTDCSSPFLRFGLPTGCCATHEGDRHHLSSLCNSSFPTSSFAAFPQPAHSRIQHLQGAVAKTPQ